ncbi:MAG: glycoside hydrolase family 3 N-terminal domain-containing protein [Bacteroidota bacterium]
MATTPKEGTQEQTTYQYAWQDSSLTVSSRVQLLLGEMTFSEKVGQLRYDSPAIERLNIPAYNWWNEALHGVARSAKATVFPQAIGLAATFDEGLMNRVGNVISDESRAIYNLLQQHDKPMAQYMGLTYWSPNVNIFRDPRWGRGQETYGEDPLLAGRLGAAFIKGMQGDDPNGLKVATCAKHFAVHSGPEAERHGFDAKANKRDLFETYLPAFEKCIDAGVEAVMCAYNRTNGEPCCGSPYLLQDILKDQLGFKGHLVSDCGAISDFHSGHHYTESLEASIALAMQSGINLNCGQSYQEIPALVEKGIIAPSLVDSLLAPLLSTRFKLGMFNRQDQRPYAHLGEKDIHSSAHQALSKEAAQKSIVLLQNKEGVLPLRKDLDFLYMVGPMGGNVLSLLGNYNGLSPDLKTVVEGITEKVSPITRVEYRPGALLHTPNSNPIDWFSVQSREADATVVVLGFTAMLEGEEGEAIASTTHGDNPTLKLPESQLELLRKLATDEKPVIAVICSGSPVDLTEVLPLTDALLFAWYPGEAGGEALADIIFGDVSPSGKLPITFPQHVDQLPPFNNYSMKGRTYKYMTKPPLFPFGYGMTYGKPMIEKLEAKKENDSLKIVGRLMNEGKYDTNEVLQLYTSFLDGPSGMPQAELKNFKRVYLKKGVEEEVVFSIDSKDIFYYNEEGQKIPYKGALKVTIGFSAPIAAISKGASKSVTLQL